MKPIALTVKGATEATGLGVTTIYKLINEGKLRRVKVGRRTLIATDSIDALMAEAA